MYTNGVGPTLGLPVAARQAAHEGIFHFRPLTFADETSTHPEHHPPLRFGTTSDRPPHQHNGVVEQQHLGWFTHIPTPLAKVVRGARVATRQAFRGVAPLLETEFDQELPRLRLSVIQQVQYSTLQQLELSITNIEAPTGALHGPRATESTLRVKAAELDEALKLASTRLLWHHERTKLHHPRE